MEVGKVIKRGGDLFFFLFFFLFLFFFFCFSLFKTTGICLGIPKWEFSTGKMHFTPGKKSGKNDFAPSEKYACYAPESVPSFSRLLAYKLAFLERMREKIFGSWNLT